MPDRELIHASSDVFSTVQFALDRRLDVIADVKQTEPTPCRVLTLDGICGDKPSVFYFLRPEWVYGPFQMMKIDAGINRGKYFLQPRVNFTAVTIYFSGDRIDQGRRRLGSCVVSSHPDWLEMPAMVLHPAPSGVRTLWKQLFSHLSSGISIKAGVHTYYITKGVIADPLAPQCLPPFDFIPWGPHVLNRLGRTAE